jgi:hypothetical protein
MDTLTQYQLAGKNYYDYIMSTSKHEAMLRLDQFLKSEKWQEKLNQWAELGICMLSDEAQNPQKNQVNIFIKRDSAELPVMLKVSLCSMMKNSNIDCDFTNHEQDQERVRKHNLTYFRDLASCQKEFKLLDQMLPKSNDATRLKILTDFNLKWKGQLEASYAINHEIKTGNLKITDASGQIICNNTENHIYLDRIRPTTTPILHAQRRELPQPAAQNAAPARNGTDRYDLRITGQKRSFKN